MAKSFGPGEAPRVVNGTVWTMLVLALAFVALRLYCRAVRSKKLWWDDYILAVSAVLLIIATSFLTKAMSLGYLDYNPNSVDVVLNWRIAQCHQIVSLALGKTSFGLTLLRFSTKFEKYVIWFVIVTVNLLFATHAFVLWLGPCGHPLPYHHIPGVCWEPTNAIIMNITAASMSAPLPAAGLLPNSSNSVLCLDRLHLRAAAMEGDSQPEHEEVGEDQHRHHNERWCDVSIPACQPIRGSTS